MISLGATSLIAFIDRIFLARHSLDALGGYASGFVIASIFQMPLTRLATIGQAFVGYYKGADEKSQIGSSVWQMIWFSLFSSFICVPIGYALMPVVFSGSSVEWHAKTYFTYMLWANFLFPLQTALTSFFVGLGKTTLVLFITLSVYACHILFSYVAILGIPGYFTPLGLQGAAIVSIIDQVLLCTTLFSLFFFVYRKEYSTNISRFNWNIFRSQLVKGIPAAIMPFLNLSAWAAISRIMAAKGGDYLVVFSIGTSLTIGFAFMRDALFQAVMTSVSELYGSKNYRDVKKLIYSALLLLGILSAVLAFPLLLFPDVVLKCFFTAPISLALQKALFVLCFSTWLFFLCDGARSVGMGALAATQNMVYFIVAGIFAWLLGYLPTRFVMEVLNWPAECLWFICSFTVLAGSVLFFYRVYQSINSTLCKEELPG
jgi:MATE family multidrug resistance protein